MGWDFILIMLKSLGFGLHFMQIVQTLFFDASTTISTNEVMPSSA